MNLDYLFHPQSVAVIGVSSDLTRVINPGRAFIQSLFDGGYKGQVYAVGLEGGEVFGMPVYLNIRDVPGNVDYVISAIPAQYTPQLVADSASKGVKAIHFFTSGFSEIESSTGKRLEAEILQNAKSNGIRIIGPNCMGIYCPKTGLTFALDLPDQSGFPCQSGPLGFISQSGGNSNYCVNDGAVRGVHFSKVISYGNAADLNETDFLEYMADDPDTEIIGMYIEGIKNGPRFIRALQRATAKKPVIIYKAGLTEAGTRATASHTGAIAGSGRTWEALFKQTGAIPVNTVDEIIDLTLLFLRIPPPRGKNTAILGAGGGAAVRAADECSRAGLGLPILPPEIRKRLMEINVTEAGQFYRNPVDVWDAEKVTDSIKTVVNCDAIDLLILHVAFDMWPLANKKYIVIPFVDSFRASRALLNKPAVVVLHTQTTETAKILASQELTRLRDAGFAVYPSFSRAALAINRFIQYHKR